MTIPLDLIPRPEIQHPILTTASYPFGSTSSLHPPLPLSDPARPPILDQLASGPNCWAFGSILQPLLHSFRFLALVSHIYLANPMHWLHPCLAYLSHTESQAAQHCWRKPENHTYWPLQVLVSPKAARPLVSRPLCLATHSHSLIWTLLSPALQGRLPVSLYILFLDNLISCLLNLHLSPHYLLPGRFLFSTFMYPCPWTSGTSPMSANKYSHQHLENAYSFFNAWLTFFKWLRSSNTFCKKPSPTPDPLPGVLSMVTS